MGQSHFIESLVKDWQRLRPEADLSSLGPMQRLIWSGRLLEDLLERTASMNGFRRRGDYEVLASIRGAEPNKLTPNEVADRLLASRSGMTARIDRLEQQALLERTPDPFDRRMVRLSLTQAGRKQMDKAVPVTLAQYDEVFEAFTVDERMQLDRLLRKLLSRLEDL